MTQIILGHVCQGVLAPARHQQRQPFTKIGGRVGGSRRLMWSLKRGREPLREVAVFPPAPCAFYSLK